MGYNIFQPPTTTPRPRPPHSKIFDSLNLRQPTCVYNYATHTRCSILHCSAYPYSHRPIGTRMQQHITNPSKIFSYVPERSLVDFGYTNYLRKTAIVDRLIQKTKTWIRPSMLSYSAQCDRNNNRPN